MATIYGGAIKNTSQGEYGFDIQTLSDGDEVEVGTLTFRVLHTPGHSSEHLSYVLSGGGRGAEHEWAVFTGDTLFAGEVGRPDLEPGADHEELAAMLFDALDKLLELDDGVEVYPGHGEGSPCGGAGAELLPATEAREPGASRRAYSRRGDSRRSTICRGASARGWTPTIRSSERSDQVRITM